MNGNWICNGKALKGCGESCCASSVGEVMAIGRNFEEAIQKAVRMVNPALDGLEGSFDPSLPLDTQLKIPTDRYDLLSSDSIHLMFDFLLAYLWNFYLACLQASVRCTGSSGAGPGSGAHSLADED